MPVKEGNRPALIGIGLIAGLLQVLVGVAMYLAGVYFKPWSMLVTGVVLLLCIVVGTRWYSVKYLNDEISYKKALIVGVVIAVSTGVVYAVYNLISINFLYSGFLDELVRVQMAQRQPPESFDSLRAGVGASEIAVANLIRLSVMGSLLSVLCAFFLKRVGRKRNRL
ncbi:MAG TPA: DUF4199 domain-containing protein [Pyrinomonadaceae bacterium]